jgi:hypothetical protein
MPLTSTTTANHGSIKARCATRMNTTYETARFACSFSLVFNALYSPPRSLNGSSSAGPCALSCRCEVWYRYRQVYRQVPRYRHRPFCSNAAIHGSTEQDRWMNTLFSSGRRNGKCGRKRLPRFACSLSSLTRCIRHRDGSMVRPVLDRALFRVHWHWRYRTEVYRRFPNIATDPFCSNAPSMGVELIEQ